jgi:hypothetical protein
MLWALLALYLFGSSGSAELTASFDHVKTFIKTDIEDKARRTELLSIVDDAEKTTKEFLKTGGKVVKELSDTLEQHNAKLADFQPVLEKFRADTVAYQSRMIRYRFDLKAKMSREEWARIFPKEESSLAPAGVQTK